MIHTGLIGWPLGHSFSPKIHKLAFDIAGIDGEYSLFPVDPTESGGLKNILAELRAGVYSGLNVTIPHKITIAGLVDELMPTASRIGAVNTVFAQNGRLIGANTDAPGFIYDLTRKFGNECLERGSALIFGAGGSARAVITALLEKGIDLSVAVRDPQKAEADLFGLDTAHSIRILDLLSVDNELLSKYELFINTTPLGMTPNTSSSPLAADIHFPTGGYSYDLVYNPARTRFYDQALRDGCKATTGFGMLVEQALVAFEIWTGVVIERDKFYARYSAMEETK